MRDIDAIVIHHSASRYTALTWAEIKKYHMEVRGYADVAYHAAIINDSNLLSDKGGWAFVEGRPYEKIGAHCKGFNLASIGVMFEGNYSVDELPKDAFEMGALWTASLCRRFKVPAARVFPHREVGTTKTECPGLKFPWDAFIARVSEQIGRKG